MAGDHWISAATARKGALHRHLGVAKGKKIPLKKLKSAVKRGGAIAQEANLAITLRTMHRGPKHL